MNEVIIGGGISALYYAKPYATIINKGKIGGRIRTSSYGFEEGALRFTKKHKLLQSLIKKYNLTPIPIISTQKIIYEDKDVSTLYKSIIKKIKVKNSDYNKTAKQLAEEQLSSYELSIVQVGFGYDEKFEEMNAIDFYSHISSYTQKYYILKEGLSTLVDKIVEDKKLNIISDKVLNVKYNNTYEIFLMSKKIIKAKKIVIACPPHYWRNWDVAYPFFPLTYSVKSQTLNRVYAKFTDYSPKYHYITSLPIRQFVPINDDITMIAYATDNNASEFLTIKNFWNWIKPQIKKITNSIPKKPKWIKQNYWNPGTHLWSPNFLSKKISNEMLNLPFYNHSLKIIGEAFSLNQGWIEGALETVKTKYKSVKYKKFTLNDVEKNNYIVLWGFVYDIKDWIPKHPGGSVINYGVGKDATQIFIRVGHSEQAFQFMEKYRIGIII